MSEFLFSILFGLNAVVFSFFLLIVAVIIAALFVGKKREALFFPKVSVVVPCYNEEKRISAFFKYLLASNYDKKKIEVVLVDDGSTDNTVKLVTSFAKEIKLKIIKTNHVGKVDAVNIGVKKASNEIIVCIDADTFVEKDAIKNIVSAFSDSRVGAASGVCLVKNNSSVLGTFQDLEYFYVGLIRKSFSRIFSSGIWFFGAISCFRKSVFLEVGGLSKDTIAEDHDFSLAVMRKGYRVVTVEHAVAHTIVPETLSGLVSQRTRWWFGALQSIRKHFKLLFSSNFFVFGFVALNHVWWYIFAVISLPLLVYQFLYWLPAQGSELFFVADYTFRWITFYGSIYLLFMLKQWNLSFYQALGSICGIFTVFVIGFGIISFKGKITIKRGLALFFYFPYTILLNMIIITSLLKVFSRKKFFLK